MKVNKDTQIYGSFSENPGNTGCGFHNKGFEKLGINAIYKSFKVSHLYKAFEAMRTLDIKGAGISMPHKETAFKYADVLEPAVEAIGAANTVLHTGPNGSIRAYNTDWLACRTILEDKKGRCHILGDGGFSKATQYACKKLNMEFRVFNRDNWDDHHHLRNSLVFNCTPMDKDWIGSHESNDYIDCLVTTPTGKWMAEIQAKAQFKLYTGYDYPL